MASHNHFETPYSLISIHPLTEQLIWKARVWASGGLIADYEGVGIHWVKLAIDGPNLLVFGMGGECVYIESVDRQTGKNNFRFTTSY